MTSKVSRIAYYLILATLAGCANLPPLPFLSQPTPATVPQATATPQPIPTTTLSAPSALTDKHVLRVWLPSRFAPNSGSVAADLLAQRLANFESAHPGLRLEIRIKAEEGGTSLLNSLTLTNNAAPSILPDLIVLSRADLESAASQGLLHPMDGLSTLLEDPSWYPYARDLGHIQNIGYGLPFAGDALVLVHHPELEIKTWDDILGTQQSLLFSAGDRQALTALSLYVSAGGKLVNEQGKPTLEEDPLIQTLELIQNGMEAKTFSASLLSLKTDEQAFQAYIDGRAPMVITWASNQRDVPGDVMQVIPSVGSTVSTFTTGWMWALAGSAPEKQQLATELAEYLMDDVFLHAWISGTGYLPTRNSITYQPEAQINPILEAAQVIPTSDVLEVLGPVMNQAVSRILNGEQVQVVVRSVMDLMK